MTTITARHRRPKPERISDIESEEGYLCGLIEFLIDKPEEGRKQCDAGTVSLFSDHRHREIFLGLRDVFATDNPTRHDLPAAIRRHVHDAAAGGVTDPAIIRHSELLATIDASPGAYILGCVRHLGRLVEIHHRQMLADAAANATAAAAGDGVTAEHIEALAASLSRLKDSIAGNRTSDRKLNIQPFSAIKKRPKEWLWKNRIVDGGLTILTGPVGNTKSLLSIDIAARVSLGSMWPDNSGHAPKGGVLLFGNEDEPDCVLKPRLEEAGADESMVRYCWGSLVRGQKYDDPVKLEHDIGLLRVALDEFPECRLIIFDPLTDYIDGDHNSAAEVRAAVMPLVQLAQERKIAVVAVCHQSKKNDLGAVQKIAGSNAFAQVARVIICVGDDPENDTGTYDRKRIMLVAKCNYGGEGTGQSYRLKRRDGDEVHLEWIDGEIVMRADELVRKPSGGVAHREKRANAIETLRDILAAGEVLASKVEESMHAGGFSRRQIDAAVEALAVIKRQAGRAWHWSLPSSPGRFPEFDQFEPDDLEEWADPFPKPR